MQHNRKLSTWGRTIIVPESSSTVAKFHFDELCGMPLSAADYLEIVKHFKTIFILDVPKMGLNQKDKARRFITFIDGEHIRVWWMFALRLIYLIRQLATRARLALLRVLGLLVC